MSVDDSWRLGRERISQFEAIAAAYDRHRQPLPDELLDTLARVADLRRGSRVVEIGSGTGLATAHLLRRGYRVVCVEPGESLAAIARAKFAANPDVEWVTSRFEEWAGPRHAFDVVFASDSWHWIEPVEGARRARDLLRIDGRLAIAWQIGSDYEPDGFAARFEETWARVAPEAMEWLRTRLDDGSAWIAASVATGLFEEVHQSRHPVVRVLSAQRFIDEMATYGWVLGLRPEAREAGLSATARLIEVEFADRIVSHEAPVLYVLRPVAETPPDPG